MVSFPPWFSMIFTSAEHACLEGDDSSRVKYVYIYTIYTWKSVYRVWSDFGGVYRVEVYIGLKNPIFYPGG